MRITRSLLLAIVASLFFLSCSSDDGGDKKSSTEQPVEIAKEKIPNPHNLTERELEIQEILTEALVRLSYGDKTGLYDLEFDYYTDEYSYDDFLTRGEVKYAQMDSIDYLEIVSTEMFEDSIILNVFFVFKSSGDQPTKIPNRFLMFKQSDGAWKKPTMTSLFHQREYENVIRKADSAAAAEEG